MKSINMGMKTALGFALAGMLVMGQADAKGKDKHADKRDEVAKHHFEDRHRVVVSQYYTEQFNAGRCPPGLAKKHNGCMSPGQAKKWNVGQRLPVNVAYYAVPASLTVQFGPPPAGCRYVRVGTDILLISISNRLIVDAIII